VNIKRDVPRGRNPHLQDNSVRLARLHLCPGRKGLTKYARSIPHNLAYLILTTGHGSSADKGGQLVLAAVRFGDTAIARLNLRRLVPTERVPLRELAMAPVGEPGYA
jgi:hypothetical protein